MSEGVTSAENAPGTDGGTVQVCVYSSYIVHWEGQIDLSQCITYGAVCSVLYNSRQSYYKVIIVRFLVLPFYFL